MSHLNWLTILHLKFIVRQGNFYGLTYHILEYMSKLGEVDHLLEMPGHHGGTIPILGTDELCTQLPICFSTDY